MIWCVSLSMLDAVCIEGSQNSRKLAFVTGAYQVWMLSMLGKTTADDIYKHFSPENKLWQFMQILSWGDKLHEMLKPTFWKILYWSFTAQSTQWGHIERGQFT